MTGILVMLSIALLVLSLWRNEDLAGKIGVAVVVAGWILQSILFGFFNA